VAITSALRGAPMFLRANRSVLTWKSLPVPPFPAGTDIVKPKGL
jgi:hypothetical protein